MSDNSLLLVEDEPLVRESLAEFLGGAGYDLSQASSEEEALQCARRKLPAVVVSDLMLGQGSGLSLFARLRKEFSGKDEPCCILMTGFGTVDNAVEAIRHGVDDYLCKPVRLEELHSAVRGGLARRRFRIASRGDHADALLDRFYHEVSAPMTLLRAYLDMFGEGRFGPLSAIQSSKMESIRRNMQSVVGAMRASHLRRSELPPQSSRQTIDPGLLLGEVQKTFYLDFERRGVNVVMGLPSSLPRVEADLRQASMVMEAILGNCLVNARFGMTLRIRWIQAPEQLVLQLRLEGMEDALGSLEPDLAAFDPAALAKGGLALESRPQDGLSELVFLHPLA
jgi:ActR/RegA family two-component response regulator